MDARPEWRSLPRCLVSVTRLTLRTSSLFSTFSSTLALWVVSAKKNSEDSIADEKYEAQLYGVKHIFEFLKADLEEIIFRRAGQKINNIDTQSLRNISTAGAVLFPLQTLIANRRCLLTSVLSSRGTYSSPGGTGLIRYMIRTPSHYVEITVPGK